MQVWEHWTTGTLMEIMDSSLSSLAPRDQMLKCIHIGLLCVQDDPGDRPMMSTVNVMLSSSTVTLQAPSRPAFCIPKSGFNSEMNSEVYPGASQSASRSPMSLNDVSITELEPRWWWFSSKKWRTNRYWGRNTSLLSGVLPGPSTCVIGIQNYSKLPIWFSYKLSM